MEQTTITSISRMTFQWSSFTEEATQVITNEDTGKMTEETNNTADGTLTIEVATVNDEYDMSILVAIDYYLCMYVAPILASTGLVGNLLALVVLLSKWFRSSQASLLLSLQSVVDSFYLLLILLPYMLGSDTFYLLPVESFIASALFTGSKYLSFLLSSFSLTLLSVVRTFVVSYPIQAAVHQTRKLSLIAFLVLVLAPAAAGGLQFLFILEPIDGDLTPLDIVGYGKCKLKIEFQAYFSIWAIVYPVISFLVPFIVILASNIAILVNMRKSMSEMSDLHNCSAGHTNDFRDARNKERSITIMIVLLGMVFFLTNAPIYVSFSLYWTGLLALDNEYDVKLQYTVYTMGETIAILNSSLNVFLYYVYGSAFRNATKQLVKSVCSRT